jgi:hypothetical protein
VIRTSVALDVFPPDALAADDTDAQTTPDVVQFSSFNYYSSEENPTIQITVVRIGRNEERSRVHLSCKDGSAKTGIQYIAIDEVIEFEPGEDYKHVYVKVLQNDSWDTTTEFSVILHQDALLRGAVLGRYAWTARVKIIDDDTFPTNKYHDKIVQQDWASLPRLGLLFEYFKMNINRPGIRSATIKIMLVDQVRNLLNLVNLLLNVYLVDDVLRREKATWLVDSVTWLWILFSFRTTGILLLHYLDYRKIGLRVGGKSRMTLQKALVRKYLNYDSQSRANVDQSGVLMAVSRDAAALVEQGYNNVIRLARQFSGLLYLVAFSLFNQFIFKRSISVFIIIQHLAFPVLMATFLAVRPGRPRSTFER